VPHFPTDILIAGQWRRGAGEPVDTVDPATGRIVATVHSASADEVAEAAEAAAKAAADPAWRDLLPHERARLLHRIAELTEEAADELSALQTADTGKTLTETRALALSAAGTFRYMAAALETAEDSVTPSRGPYVTMSVY
jgi:aldehyde dehydrogenase (NAD+)